MIVKTVWVYHVYVRLQNRTNHVYIYVMYVLADWNKRLKKRYGSTRLLLNTMRLEMGVWEEKLCGNDR